MPANGNFRKVPSTLVIRCSQENMFISDEYKLIVMLPQKCASSSLQLRLQSIRSPESLDTHPRYEKELGKYISKHITIKTALKLKAYKSRLDYHKACFVRNPYDRVYSWFQWLEKSSKRLIEEVHSGDLFEMERVAHMTRSRDRKLKKMKEADYEFNRYLKLNKKSFKSACRFTHHRGRCHVDFIGHQENFDSDYQAFVSRYGLPVTNTDDGNIIGSHRCEKKPQEMTADDYQYVHWFNRDSVQTINRLFRKDFKYFSYPVLDPKSFPRSVE